MDFTYFIVLLCIEALIEQVVCLKRLRTATLESFESLFLLRLMGVLVPSLHRESTDSLITAVFGSSKPFVYI